jgi:hypothetical protein
LICHEFATARAAGVLNTFATARTNDIVPLIAVQDISQLKLEYSVEEANLVLNISGKFFAATLQARRRNGLVSGFPRC